MNIPWNNATVIAQTRLVTRSYRKWLGDDLLPGLFNPLGLSKHVFNAPFVLVSHGTEADPALELRQRGGAEALGNDLGGIHTYTVAAHGRSA